STHNRARRPGNPKSSSAGRSGGRSGRFSELRRTASLQLRLGQPGRENRACADRAGARTASGARGARLAKTTRPMMWNDWAPLWLNQLSNYGGKVDLLFSGLLLMSFCVSGLLFILLLGFAIRYRKGSDADRDHRITKSWRWEISWTVVTFIAFLVLFEWG